MSTKPPHHPGLLLLRDYVRPSGLTVAEIARRLGVSRRRLSDVLSGRSNISPLMAVRLGMAFGERADKWARLQAGYDAAQALNDSSDIKVECLWRGVTRGGKGHGRQPENVRSVSGKLSPEEIASG